MKLLTSCIGCKGNIYVKSSAKTRPDLEYEKGENFSVTCKECHRKQSKSPNDVKAIVTHNTTLIGVGISVIVTAALWSILGAIGTISLSIPLYMSVDETKSVATFNKYRL